jgi:hypothetical protein
MTDGRPPTAHIHKDDSGALDEPDEVEGGATAAASSVNQPRRKGESGRLNTCKLTVTGLATGDGEGREGTDQYRVTEEPCQGSRPVVGLSVTPSTHPSICRNIRNDNGITNSNNNSSNNMVTPTTDTVGKFIAENARLEGGNAMFEAESTEPKEENTQFDAALAKQSVVVAATCCEDKGLPSHLESLLDSTKPNTGRRRGTTKEYLEIVRQTQETERQKGHSTKESQALRHEAEGMRKRNEAAAVAAEKRKLKEKTPLECSNKKPKPAPTKTTPARKQPGNPIGGESSADSDALAETVPATEKEVEPPSAKPNRMLQNHVTAEESTELETMNAATSYAPTCVPQRAREVLQHSLQTAGHQRRALDPPDTSRNDRTSKVAYLPGHSPGKEVDGAKDGTAKPLGTIWGRSEEGSYEQVRSPLQAVSMHLGIALTKLAVYAGDVRSGHQYHPPIEEAELLIEIKAGIIRCQEAQMQCISDATWRSHSLGHKIAKLNGAGRGGRLPDVFASTYASEDKKAACVTTASRFKRLTYTEGGAPREINAIRGKRDITAAFPRLHGESSAKVRGREVLSDCTRNATGYVPPAQREQNGCHDHATSHPLCEQEAFDGIKIRPVILLPRRLPGRQSYPFSCATYQFQFP